MNPVKQVKSRKEVHNVVLGRDVGRFCFFFFFAAHVFYFESLVNPVHERFLCLVLFWFFARYVVVYFVFDIWVLRTHHLLVEKSRGKKKTPFSNGSTETYGIRLRNFKVLESPQNGVDIWAFVRKTCEIRVVAIN